MRTLPDLSVYLVLDADLCGPRGMVATARAAVAGGVHAVQLRHKTSTNAEMISLGHALMAALDGTPGRVIINDNVEAACAIGAHGLHIGQGDMPVADARARIGAGPILGVSVETLDAARAIDPALVDYVGAGPVFATRTKADHKPPVGWDGLAAIVAAAPVPAVAIGGLKAVHMAQVRAAGAAGAAVVSAICGQPDPEAAARELARNFAKAPA